MKMTLKQNEGGSPLALVLDGSKSDDREARVARETVVSELGKAGFSCSEHILRDEEVAPCIGCFKCWVKTPGECVYKDQGKQIAMDMARCRVIVLVTPVTFGGYSSELKKGLDRVLPILLPDFANYDGETHHPHRYSKGFDVIAIGTMPRENEQNAKLFRDLVVRNSLNMHSSKRPIRVVIKGQGEDAVRKQAVDAVKEMIA